MQMYWGVGVHCPPYCVHKYIYVSPIPWHSQTTSTCQINPAGYAQHVFTRVRTISWEIHLIIIAIMFPPSVPPKLHRQGQGGAYFTTSHITEWHNDNKPLGIIPPAQRKTPPAVKLEGLQVGEEGDTPTCCRCYYLLSNPAM